MNNQNFNAEGNNQQNYKNGYNQYNTSNNQSNFVPVQNEFTKWLILGILQLICCNQITGVLAIVFAVLGNSEYSRGNMDMAAKHFKGAKVASIVGVILGILIYAFVFGIYGLMYMYGMM